MVMSIDRKTLFGQHAGYVVISPHVLAHAVNKHDDPGALTLVGIPAISDKLPAVGGAIAKGVWLHHRVPLARGHPDNG
jgi:hypothetical protein